MTTNTAPATVFVGTLTTSTRPGARAWEIGVLVRTPDGHEIENHWFVDTIDLDLGNANYDTLQSGRFYARHPQMTNPHSGVEFGNDNVFPEQETLERIERLARGAILVGINPADVHVLAERMRWHDICPSWQPHTIDATAYAAGAIAVRPPWNLDALATAHGIDVDPDDRHTALGRARLASELYDVVFAGEEDE